MNLEQFKVAIEAAGLKLRECNDYHLQVTGCLRPVNLHFNSAGVMTRIYVNGMQKGIGSHKATFEEALKIATTGDIEPDVKAKRPSRNARRNIKKRLGKKQDKCFWCGKPLVKGQTSLEHKVPLKNGGSNRRDNLALCCPECNDAHRNATGKPAGQKTEDSTAADAVFAEIGGESHS